jgi:hypothetical protein
MDDEHVVEATVWDWTDLSNKAGIFFIWKQLSVGMASAPRYVVLAHTTQTGGVIGLHLLDNSLLKTEPLSPHAVPEWLKDALAVLRYCEAGELATPEVSGYKMSEFMVAVTIDAQKYAHLQRLGVADGSDT